jgi:VanZ family protein
MLKDNQRDALTHLGIALASFGLIRANLITGWSFWIMVIGTIIFALLSVKEFFFSK